MALFFRKLAMCDLAHPHVKRCQTGLFLGKEVLRPSLGSTERGVLFAGAFFWGSTALRPTHHEKKSRRRIAAPTPGGRQVPNKNHRGLEGHLVSKNLTDSVAYAMWVWGLRLNLPLKTPSPGEVFIFYRHIAHVTPKKLRKVVFLRGK